MNRPSIVLNSVRSEAQGARGQEKHSAKRIEHRVEPKKRKRINKPQRASSYAVCSASDLQAGR